MNDVKRTTELAALQVARSTHHGVEAEAEQDPRGVAARSHEASREIIDTTRAAVAGSLIQAGQVSCDDLKEEQAAVRQMFQTLERLKQELAAFRRQLDVLRATLTNLETQQLVRPRDE